MLGLNFNMFEELAFYGEYHSDWRNQLIHVIFVPAIFWSFLVMFTATGPLVSVALPAVLAEYVVLNGAFFVTLFYASYYLVLDLKPALLANVGLWGMYIGANAFARAFPDNFMAVAVAVNAFGWWAQIHPGHGIFEGRKPALLDSFFQSLVLAPFFVFNEVLFWMGFRKELRQRLEKEVARRKAAWRQREGKKKA